MKKVKQSFLSSLIGEKSYEEFRNRCRNQYDFECATFLVQSEAAIVY